jgi:hypothetical protein
MFLNAEEAAGIACRLAAIISTTAIRNQCCVKYEYLPLDISNQKMGAMLYNYL